MGIRHFFHWFKNRFSENIYKMRKGETFDDIKEEAILDDGIQVDNFMIDMNGLFHRSAQKVHQYGDYKPPKRLLGRRRQQHRGGLQKQLDLFKDVCAQIEECFDIVKPKKRLILCVDGPAPLSKQNQQRQRRFVSATQKTESEIRAFDSNCITPGTKFMDYLTKYVDWFIRKRMSEDPKWQKIEVVFSNEKAPGEGEHKIINFIRFHGEEDESYCIHGMDADLIMLSLGTHVPEFYILREEPRNPNFEFYAINIGGVRQELGEILRWDGSEKKRVYNIESAVNDFIFMCFTVGNDFLPHIPGIEIAEGGIEFMIDVYKNVCESYGHITKKGSRGLRFSKRTLTAFLGTLSQYEKGVLEDKLEHKGDFFPDPILEANAELKAGGKYELDIENYREDYYNACLPEVKDMEKLCHDYLEGMQWVLSYYTSGVSNWKWRYPYHYAPFAATLAKHVKKFSFPVYSRTVPTVPFVQLLSVLPPKSHRLLPQPLNQLLASETSVMSTYCPEDFAVDLAGKRREWEGIVILPMVDYHVVEKEYFNLLAKVDNRETKRNMLGKSFIYFFSDKTNFVFRSYYGDVNCRVKTRMIEL